MNRGEHPEGPPLDLWTADPIDELSKKKPKSEAKAPTTEAFCLPEKEGLSEGDLRPEAEKEGLSEGDLRAEAEKEGLSEGDLRAEAEKEGLPEGDLRAEAAKEGLSEGDSRTEAPEPTLHLEAPEATLEVLAVARGVPEGLVANPEPVYRANQGELNAEVEALLPHMSPDDLTNPEDRAKVLELQLSGLGVCSRCRFRGGCLSCSAEKALRYFLRKQMGTSEPRRRGRPKAKAKAVA